MFEGARKKDFVENGEINLSFALRIGVYILHRWEFCKVKTTLKCIGRKLARPHHYKMWVQFTNPSSLDQ
jgi:hypothetical protein